MTNCPQYTQYTELSRSTKYTKQTLIAFNRLNGLNIQYKLITLNWLDIMKRLIRQKIVALI